MQQLERLNIVGLKDRSVNTLSGGEQNFTALAGVLAMQPRVLLLDEPTNGLDVKKYCQTDRTFTRVTVTNAYCLT